MRYLMGIDLGTSGTKTVLFSEKGELVASHMVEYGMLQPHNGWAEQDPMDWWNAAVTTIQAVLKESGVDKDAIVGLGIAGQMHGLVMLDEKGELVRNSIIWCDQRTAKECEEMNRKIGEERLIELSANPALTGFTASKILWVRNNQPEIYAKCKHILLPKDYLRYKLTGEYATEVSDASGFQLLDVKNRCWSGEILEKLEIDPALLGKVYESPEITGTISREAADLTGLSTKTVVVGGAGDNAAAAVGTGVVRDNTAFTTIGTSGVVYAHTSRPQIDPQGRVHTFCCAVPGAWHVMGVTQAAGLSLKWLRDTVCEDIVAEAEKKGVDPYALMDDIAEGVPIGADKLLYLPYLMGERTPHKDPDCRGAFVGLSAMHTKAHLIRSVMEGVTYSLRDCYDILMGMHCDITQMIACGGGSVSSIWRQMMADVYGCPVNRVQSKEGPALGVTILAGVGAGVFSSVEEGCDAWIQVKDECPPIPENTPEYEKFYKLYASLYPVLKDSYKALAKL